MFLCLCMSSCAVLCVHMSACAVFCRGTPTFAILCTPSQASTWKCWPLEPSAAATCCVSGSVVCPLLTCFLCCMTQPGLCLYSSWPCVLFCVYTYCRTTAAWFYCVVHSVTVLQCYWVAVLQCNWVTVLLHCAESQCVIVLLSGCVTA